MHMMLSLCQLGRQIRRAYLCIAATSPGSRTDHGKTQSAQVLAGGSHGLGQEVGTFRQSNCRLILAPTGGLPIKVPKNAEQYQTEAQLSACEV